MKKVVQFRYFRDYEIKQEIEGSESLSKNYPVTLSANDLYAGKIFEKYTPITQIGIQGLPGTIFYLNDRTKQNPIILGYTGMYELDLEGYAEINSLQFELESIRRIANSDNAYLIIDIIYDSEEVI